ncbi:MAG: isoleucine--tRNA ligase [Candidatus Nanopelagicales bacterium]|nr:isoleucine--tRNA ligase [Candidatus Nanopelagicales bacterium]
MYKSVPPAVNLTELEHEVLAFWDHEGTFAQSLQRSEGRPRWTFYEGPPTANGTPGAHHLEARAFKDIFPRYRTMKGYHVPRQAGWDCHGLPVELAVEKELGFTGKGDIEEFGVAEFNAKCRESVLRHVDEFTAMTHRMGYWVDMDSAYWTMDPQYVQSVWWSLKQIFRSGLLVQDHRVSPYCPRCGTGLSDHELAQGYEEVVDPSVYVRFPVTSGTLAEKYADLNLLIWTTTPWTLVSNTAVAVKPSAQYCVVSFEGSHYVVAQELVEQVFGPSTDPDGSPRYTVEESFPGTELERIHYQRPFNLVEIPDAHFVLLADYVTTDDGTGLVHQAPAFGADDLITCRAYGLPVVNPIAPNGTFDDSVPLVGGEFFKSADTTLTEDLSARGLLFRMENYEHAYPHCWRCHTPLIYYAQPSWYIRTTAIKDQLMAQNEQTNWFPETIQWGRYGDWLTNNVDWALSRNRFWGTPLPIWRCENNHLTAIESLAELSELTGRDLSDLDPHRPFIDAVTFPCGECGEIATRVPEVIDCWYDSGAMPFAAQHYPQSPVDTFTDQYPADFICEAIDQTRGWFYTLMAIGTLVFQESSYKNVVCLGHILDEDGRKMSKHLGNVLEPIPLMDQHGADAVRWFMLASGSPWQSRRVGHNAIADVVRKSLLTYWNTVSFLALYARSAPWQPSDGAPPLEERPIMDRWLINEAHALSSEVDHALETFDTQKGGRLIAEFIDNLSNWYVRRTRRRFWEGDPAALATLHEAVHVVTLCMAPFTPFITERVWQDLFRSTDTSAPESVHLASWPAPAPVDNTLRQHMDLARRITELGRSARAASSVKTRQPLGRALISAPGWDELDATLIDEVAQELNVRELLTLSTTDGHLVDISIKPNFRALGQRYGKQTPLIAEFLATQDPELLVGALRGQGSVTLDVPGFETAPVITADDLVITESPKEGWAVASEAGESVALDLEVTHELALAGIARELIRSIQEGRKNAGLDISDRIHLWWNSSDSDVIETWETHGDDIAAEVLAREVSREQVPGTATAISSELSVNLGLQALPAL